MNLFVKKYIRVYLNILPFYSLLGMLLSIFRTVFQLDFSDKVLLVNVILDSLIIILGRKYLLNKAIIFIFILLLISLFVGLLNGNELGRRYITDSIYPLFFFGKIFILSKYWNFHDFFKYIKYYTRITLIGSLLLLPFTYLLFRYTGSTRMSIFPPMELPFSYVLEMNGILVVILSLFVIFLYGKRAQLVGALLLLFFNLFGRKKQIPKYLFFFLTCLIVLNLALAFFPENMAVRRLSSTIDMFKESDATVDKVGGARSVEVFTIIETMKSPLDYVFGKGLGFTYEYSYISTGDEEEHANAHFSPIAFLSKYGLIFTIFIYCFLIKSIFTNRENIKERSYKIARNTCVFIFIESFFSYAIFVIPILPIALSYIIYKQKNG